MIKFSDFSLSELNPVPTTPVYIHTGESISLDCTLGIIEEAAGSTDIKWYKDGTQVEELASVVVVTDHEYDGENKNQKITYVDTSVDKDDGGVYKCEYNFEHGDPISFEITVYVHCKFVPIHFKIDTVSVHVDGIRISYLRLARRHIPNLI